MASDASTEGASRSTAAFRHPRARCRPAAKKRLVELLQREADLDPGMAPALIDGNAGCWKAGIGEGADGDGKDVGHPRQLPIDRAAAGRAEVEGDLIAAVGDAREVLCSAFDPGHLGAGKARLSPEDASRSPLAFQAMADRDPDRLPLAGKPELAAAAFGLSRRHGFASRRSEDLEGAGRGGQGGGRYGWGDRPPDELGGDAGDPAMGPVVELEILGHEPAAGDEDTEIGALVAEIARAGDAQAVVLEKLMSTVSMI